MSVIDGGQYWFTAIDVSEVLSIPLKRVYELLQRDEIRGARIGRTVMVPRPEVERLRRRSEAGRPAP
jgi:excisionase family DNA binding protein